MLHSEKLDFTGFYKCKNSPKQRFIYDFFSGEYVIIMLKGQNAVFKRISELPQSVKFEMLRVITVFKPRKNTENKRTAHDNL